MRQRYHEIPVGLEKIQKAYDDLVSDRGSREEKVFEYLDSLLQTEDWTQLVQLQIGKIVVITKELMELED
jgi:hypothetical protein